MSEPRAYTQSEIQEQFLRHLWVIVDEWEKSDRESVREKISGAVFSILAVLDGEGVDLPAFALYPEPHPSDREFRVQKGENWYPMSCEIGRGQLHKQFHRYDPRNVDGE